MRLISTIGSSDPTGAPLVVADETERLALTPAIGTSVKQTDTGFTWLYGGDGTWYASGIQVLANNSYASLLPTGVRVGLTKYLRRTPILNFSTSGADLTVEFDMAQIAAAGITEYGWLIGNDTTLVSSVTNDFATAMGLLASSRIFDSFLSIYTVDATDAAALGSAIIGFDMTFTNPIILIRPGVGTFFHLAGRLLGSSGTPIPDYNSGNSYFVDEVVFYNGLFYTCLASPPSGSDPSASGDWAQASFPIITLPENLPLSQAVALDDEITIAFVWGGAGWLQIQENF